MTLAARAQRISGAVRAGLLAGLDALGSDVARDWSAAPEIAARIKASHLASVEASAKRLAQLAAAQPVDGAALRIAAHACVEALGQLKAQLLTLKLALTDATSARARARSEAMPLMLRHFLLCRGAQFAADVLAFVQNHMVHRDFQSEQPTTLLSVKDFLCATERTREASLEAVLLSLRPPSPLPSHAASMLGVALDEERLLGDRLCATIWALYKSNVSRVRAESEVALERARATRDVARGASGHASITIALLDEAIFSAEMHAERSSERVDARDAFNLLGPFVKIMGVHGCVLQTASRAFKQLTELASLSSVALGRSSGGGGENSQLASATGTGPVRARKRLYEEGDSVDAADPGEPSTLAAATLDAETAPALASHPSRFTRIVGVFRRTPVVAVATVESKLSQSFADERNPHDDGSAPASSVDEHIAECALEASRDSGELELLIKNAGSQAPLVPLHLNVEHLVRAENVGNDHKRRWESDGFAELRTHGYDLGHVPAILPGATAKIRVRWPSSRSHHVSIVFEGSRTQQPPPS